MPGCIPGGASPPRGSRESRSRGTDRHRLEARQRGPRETSRDDHAPVQKEQADAVDGDDADGGPRRLGAREDRRAAEGSTSVQSAWIHTSIGRSSFIA
jgi:hypothetical protein